MSSWRELRSSVGLVCYRKTGEACPVVVHNVIRPIWWTHDLHQSKQNESQMSEQRRDLHNNVIFHQTITWFHITQWWIPGGLVGSIVLLRWLMLIQLNYKTVMPNRRQFKFNPRQCCNWGCFWSPGEEECPKGQSPDQSFSYEPRAQTGARASSEISYYPRNMLGLTHKNGVMASCRHTCPTPGPAGSAPLRFGTGW